MANNSREHKDKKKKKKELKQKKMKSKAEAKKQKKEIQTKAQRSEDIAKLKQSKKTLPSFLMKNIDVICQWLNNYALLIQLADDAGFYQTDRITPERRQQIVQEYVDVKEFISISRLKKFEFQNSSTLAKDAKETKDIDSPESLDQMKLPAT